MPFMRSESCSFIWHPKVVRWYLFASPPRIDLDPLEIVLVEADEAVLVEVDVGAEVAGERSSTRPPPSGV